MKAGFGKQHKEVWRSIPGFSKYEVSCCGLLRRAVKMKTRRKHSLLSASPDPDGYLRVYLFNDAGKGESRGVHQLVARAFLDPCDNPDLTWVLHKDDNNQNNFFENLKWGNVRINVDDAVKNGRLVKQPTLQDSFRSKLNWDAVRDIRSRYVSKQVTYKMLAQEYGVSIELVRMVVANEHWVE